MASRNTERLILNRASSSASVPRLCPVRRPWPRISCSICCAMLSASLMVQNPSFS